MSKSSLTEKDERSPDRTPGDERGRRKGSQKQDRHPPQREQPNESIPSYSNLKLQQGLARQQRDLHPQETYVAMLERAQLDLDAVAAHQRKTGVLQLYGQG